MYELEGWINIIFMIKITIIRNVCIWSNELIIIWNNIHFLYSSNIIRTNITILISDENIISKTPNVKIFKNSRYFKAIRTIKVIVLYHCSPPESCNEQNRCFALSSTSDRSECMSRIRNTETFGFFYFVFHCISFVLRNEVYGKKVNVDIFISPFLDYSLISKEFSYFPLTS